MDPKTPMTININSSYVINNFYGKSKQTLNHSNSHSTKGILIIKRKILKFF